jgi:hypothetical protein
VKGTSDLYVCQYGASFPVIRGLTTPDLQLWPALDSFAILADTSDRVVHKALEMKDENRRELLDKHLLGSFGGDSMSILNRNSLDGREGVECILDSPDVLWLHKVDVKGEEARQCQNARTWMSS